MTEDRNPMTSEVIPSVNARVWLQLVCCPTRSHLSRIERFVDGAIDIAPPLHPPSEGQGEPTAAELPDRHTQFPMLWSSGGAHFEMPVNRVEAHDCDKELWRVVRHGPTVTAQRRTFVRAPVTGDMTLITRCSEIKARLLDLSEGGLLCAVPHELLPYERTRLEVELTIDGNVLILLAEVVRTDTRKGTHLLGIRFTDVDSYSSGVIRRQVFKSEMEPRRRGAL